MKYLICAALVVFAGQACAQNAPDYDRAILDLCMENAENTPDRTYCIGQAAEACIITEAGASTLGLGYCYSSEWEQWDARLNTAYQALVIQQAELAEDNAAFNENMPDALELLRQMQRDWIAYRDTTCLWEVVQWGGGTGGGPASASCMMRLTALQTIFLEEHL